MKLFFAALVTYVSATAFASDLLRFHKQAGYEMKPTSVSVVLRNDGAVIKTVHYQVENETKITLVATLSGESMTKIMIKMKNVNDAAVYTDDHANEPICMDAPSYTYSMKSGSQYIFLKQEANCHETYLHDPAGMSLVEVIKSLVQLAYIN